MSMSAPFDPEQQGSGVPMDGRDQDELEVEETRSDLTGSASGADADGSPVRQHDEDEAGGGPVFRRPQAGDRLDADELAADTDTSAATGGSPDAELGS